MKKVFGVCLVLGLMGCSKNNTTDTVSNADFCKVVDDLSRAIMSNRQTGVPMVESMEIANTNDNEQAKEIIQAIVKDAYAEPRYEMKENQEKAITDFRNKIYQACIN